MNNIENLIQEICELCNFYCKIHELRKNTEKRLQELEEQKRKCKGKEFRKILHSISGIRSTLNYLIGKEQSILSSIKFKLKQLIQNIAPIELNLKSFDEIRNENENYFKIEIVNEQDLSLPFESDCFMDEEIKNIVDKLVNSAKNYVNYPKIEVKFQLVNFSNVYSIISFINELRKLLSNCFILLKVIVKEIDLPSYELKCEFVRELKLLGTNERISIIIFFSQSS